MIVHAILDEDRQTLVRVFARAAAIVPAGDSVFTAAIPGGEIAGDGARGDVRS